MSKLSYLYGALSLIFLLASAGAVEAGLYLTATVFVILVPIMVYFSAREDGSAKKGGRK